MPHPAWSTDLITGVAPLDDLHHGMMEALARLSMVRYDEFETEFGIFVQKVEHAFRTEEVWMEEIGYPDLKNHREQHARVLSALHQAHSRVMQGNQTEGRHVATELLPQWLEFHMSTMDVALGNAVQATKLAGRDKTDYRPNAVEYID